MKFILSFVSFLIISNTVFAQNDPNAKSIGCRWTKSKIFQIVERKFYHKIFYKQRQSKWCKNGTISMKGNKYVLKQGKTEIICDGANTYSYDGSKTVTVAPAEDASKSLTPQKILSGSYDKEFYYKLISSKGNFQEIELKPIDTRKNFQKVTVYIDKAKSIISKAKILDKSNNILEFSFTNLNTTNNIADNVFVFNKSKYPKDIEILD
jgi:hypothetical protein